MRDRTATPLPRPNLRRRLFAGLIALTALPGLSPFDVTPAAHSADAAVEVEAKALAAAADSGLVVLGPDGAECPVDRLRVSWAKPSAEYKVGAYLEPVGPRPTAESADVSGVVLCDGSTYAFMGFEAVRDEGAWTVSVLPGQGVDPSAPGDGEDDGSSEEATGPVDEAGNAIEPGVPVEGPSGDGVPATVPAPAASLADKLPDGIEGYAAYEPQSTCDPTPKPGVVAFRDLLLKKYPFSHSAGISRACSAGGRSEHKEGRALDWSVNVNVARDKAAAEEVLAWLQATDGAGNRNALVRRTGLMYMIWNRQIWAAYRADAGWRAYSGPSAHTDHVHFSFSWAGARGQTSFFRGTVAEVSSAALHGSGSGGSGGSGPSGTRTTPPRRSTTSTTDAPRRRRQWPSTTMPVPTTTVVTEPRRPRRTWPTTTSTTAAPAPSSTTSTTLRRWPTTTTSTTVRPTTTTTVKPTTTTTIKPTTTTTATATSSGTSTTSTTLRRRRR